MSLKDSIAHLSEEDRARFVEDMRGMADADQVAAYLKEHGIEADAQVIYDRFVAKAGLKPAADEDLDDVAGGKLAACACTGSCSCY